MSRLPLGPEGFNKIAIIGTAGTSMTLAPFKDKSWAIWACSPGAYPHCAQNRSDVWFEPHRWLPTPAGQTGAPGTRPWFSAEFHEFLKAHKGPVFMSRVEPTIPNSVAIPYKHLQEKYGPYFWTSTMSYMLAMAIDELAPRAAAGEQVFIGLWGVDMSTSEEWCVAPETRVLTADLRWVPADELDQGDQIIAFDEGKGGDTGSFREWKLATVQGVQRLKRPCKRLHLEDGTTLVSSDEHRWLTHAEHENRWAETKKMVTSAHRDGRPTRIVKLIDTWIEDKSWEAGYLAAAFDGEGHLVQIKRSECDGVQLMVGFSQRENAMSEMVLTACRSMGFDLRVAGVHGGMNGDCIKYRLAGKRSKLLEFLGRIRPRRLMAKFNPGALGKMHRKDAVAVVSVEDLGEQEVIGLKTSTGTFIAEGFASHNSYQRPGCQHFLGLAMGVGIDIMLPPESDLARPPTMYGVGEHHPRHMRLLARLREAEANRDQMRQQLAQLQIKIAAVEGTIAEQNYILGCWTDDVEDDLKNAISHAGQLVKPVGGFKELDSTGAVVLAMEADGRTR